MKVFDIYNIPIKSAYLGEHQYHFQVDKLFFEAFDESPVKDAELEIEVNLDKKTSLIDMELKIRGTVRSNCDRCLTAIDLPIEISPRILVKYDEFGKEDEEEIIYISREASHLNIAELIYDYAILAIPIIKTIDCEGNNYKYCDKEVLNYYEQKEIEKTEPEDNVLWDQLKDIKFK